MRWLNMCQKLTNRQCQDPSGPIRGTAVF